MTPRIKWLNILLAVTVFFSAVGCVKPALTPEPPPPLESSATPRVLASLQLTEQGRSLLKQGKPDAAIRVLERAINLNPGSGENYYYLSESWLKKGEAKQAKEFNHLAEIYLNEFPDWTVRIARQKDRIQELEK
ncbi:MAG: tetratricopeptide repeat protein [Thermodesulfobacteriota bacterium]|nr:tetratricopeptide repeat protein [Thermodesulfobacteriota bacterium]